MPALVTELLSDPGAVAIRPGHLGQASAATLARDRLAAEPDPVFAAALQTGSGGNPLFLVALLDALSRDGISSDRGSGVVRDRARPAGDRAWDRDPSRASARRGGAALARGGNSRRSNRAAARGRARRPGAEGGAECRERAGQRPTCSGTRTRSSSSHPVVRTAVLEDMSADERTSAHRRAAEMLLAARSAARAGGHAPRADDSGRRSVRRRRRCATRRPVARPGCAGGGGRLPAARARRAATRMRSAPTCSATSGSPRRTRRRDRRGSTSRRIAGEVDDVGTDPTSCSLRADADDRPTGASGESAELLLRLSERVGRVHDELSEQHRCAD